MGKDARTARIPSSADTDKHKTSIGNSSNWGNGHQSHLSARSECTNNEWLDTTLLSQEKQFSTTRDSSEEILSPVIANEQIAIVQCQLQFRWIHDLTYLHAFGGILHILSETVKTCGDFHNEISQTISLLCRARVEHWHKWERHFLNLFDGNSFDNIQLPGSCLLYTSPSPRDA